MENTKDRRKETWLTWLWAVVFCFCVISLATGCSNVDVGGTEDPSVTVSGPMSGEDGDGSVGAGEDGVDGSEAYQIVSEKGPGSSPEDPMVAESGMRLLEGEYYVADIDDEADEEVFCYLGSQDNGYPRFWVDGVPMDMSNQKVEIPFTANVKNEAGIFEKREVYYLVDILEGDGQKEFAILDHGEKMANYTIFCKYERSQILWIENVEGVPFAQEHTEECGVREQIGLDGQGHIVTTFASDLARLWSLYQTWELVDGGALVKVAPEGGMYEAASHACALDEGGVQNSNLSNDNVYEPYLYHSLEVYTASDRNAQIQVWEGTVQTGAEQGQHGVTFTHSDNEHWIRLELADGQVGWIYLEAPEVLVQSDGLTYIDYAIFDMKPLGWKCDKLSYEERRDLLRQQALEKEPITVEIRPEGTQLISGVLYQADLDDDGVLEKFYYDGAVYRETSRPLFIIDGKKYEIGSGFQPVISWGSRIFLGNYEEYYLCDIRKGDGQTEFAFGDESDDDGCHETDWLAFDGTWMRYIGTIDGFPFVLGNEANEWTYKISHGIWGLDGQGHVGTSEKIGPVEDMWTDVIWELDPDSGMLVKQEPENGWYVNNQSRHIPFQGGYSEDNWSVYYLQNDLPLYREPDLNAKTFVMEVQVPYYREQIYVTHTDGEHWIRVEDLDGEAGWVYLQDGKPVLSDKYMQQGLGYYIQHVFVYKDWSLEDADTQEKDQAILEYVAEQYPFVLTEAQPVTLSGGETEIKLEPGVMYSADLDGDGAAETFAYCGLSSGGNTSGYIGGNSTLYPTFWIDGQPVQSGYLQGDGYTPEMIDDWGNVLEGQQFYLCDIRRGDGWLELATLDPGPSGDPQTTFLRWDGEELQLVGRVADFPFAQENSSRAEEYANGTYGLDGRGNVTIQARADILQTWWIKETWTLDRKMGQLTLSQPKAGLFENTDPYYYREYITSGDNEYKGTYPHLLQDLPLYQKQDLNSETIVMAAMDHGVENKIYLTHTDNVHWVRVEDDAGVSGWIYLENFFDLILPEGKKNVYYYIGALNMAD